MMNGKSKALASAAAVILTLSSASALCACGQQQQQRQTAAYGEKTEALLQEYHSNQSKLDRVISASLTDEEKEAYDLISHDSYDWSEYESFMDFLCDRDWTVAYIVGNGDSDFLEVTETTPEPPHTWVLFKSSGKASGAGRNEVMTTGYWVPCNGGTSVKYVDSTGKVTEFTVSGEYLTAQSDDGTKTYTFEANG